jgi:membrane-associated protease RseP (regulator of RpoE activity)
MSDNEFKIYEVFPVQEEPQKLTIHIVLFITTFCTTLLAGAFYEGADVFGNFREIIRGLPFALTLMGILLGHEFGHYLASQYHNVRATLPYFIPGPALPGTISVGTFGAFIKMKSPFTTRSALLDIGIAGPLVGTLLAIPVFAYGLWTSPIRYVTSYDSGGISINLGSSILLHIIEKLVVGDTPDNQVIALNSIGYAGWLGLFVTSLNLIPIGQLDGGHISYAIFRRFGHRFISRLAFVFLLILGLSGWNGWFIWAVLALVIGFGHPPPIEPLEPLDRRRKILGLIGILLFILTIIPNPIQIISR